MANVLFKRGSSDDREHTVITDGLLFFDEDNKKIYMDNGNERFQYGGGTDLIDDVSQASVTNTFSGSALVNLFSQKSTVVDTKASAIAVTEQGIPLGCLAFKEALGTTNYSQVGDGTISGGLVALRGETLTATLAAGETTLVLTSTIVNQSSYIDVYVDNWKVSPSDISINYGTRQITLTFSAQSNSVQVKIIVRNM